jgi:hypothetical protein
MEQGTGPSAVSEEFMKLLVQRSLLVIAVLAFGSFAMAQKEDKPKSSVSVKYDKKKDITTVRLKSFRVTQLILEKQAMTSVPLHQTDLEISFSFAGETATKPVDDVAFRFQVSSDNYTFLRPQAVMAVLDKEVEGKGRAFSLGNSEYKSYPPKFNTIFEETLISMAPADALSKIAKAKSLEIYLGPVGYTITPSQLAGIQELATYLSPRVP